MEVINVTSSTKLFQKIILFLTVLLFIRSLHSLDVIWIILIWFFHWHWVQHDSGVFYVCDPWRTRFQLFGHIELRMMFAPRGSIPPKGDKNFLQFINVQTLKRLYFCQLRWTLGHYFQPPILKSVTQYLYSIYYYFFLRSTYSMYYLFHITIYYVRLTNQILQNDNDLRNAFQQNILLYTKCAWNVKITYNWALLTSYSSFMCFELWTPIHYWKTAFQLKHIVCLYMWYYCILQNIYDTPSQQNIKNLCLFGARTGKASHKSSICFWDL